MNRARNQDPGRQRGIAVITAMLVVTIATVLAVELAWQTNLDLRRTESLLTWDQAHLYAYGAEAYASTLLEDKIRTEGGQPEPYSRSDNEQACRGFQFSIDEGGMTGGVCDLQARFNLNNLVSVSVSGLTEPDKKAGELFMRLLLAAGALSDDVDIDQRTADIIVASAIDWIDPDSVADYNGAEDDTYTSNQPPYRAANFWFMSVSELRAVQEVTPEIFAAVAPFLAALPVTKGSRTRINVNTAEVPVLMALGESITQENAEKWVSDSRGDPFTDATQFTQFIDATVASDYIDYSSKFFELKGFVSIGTTRLGMYSLLESDGQTVRTRLRQFDVVDVVESAPPAKPDEDESMADDK